MTYATERDKVGRKSFTRFEIDLPRCALDYSIINLLTYSEQLDHANWNKRGGGESVIANDTVAPDGTTTADKVLNLGAASVADIWQILTGLTISVRYEPSFYIKKISSTGTLGLRDPVSASDGLWSVDFSLLGSDWERITRDHAAVTITNEFILNSDPGGGHQYYAVSGTLDFHWWGAQYVLGSVPGSYVKTESIIAGCTANLGTGVECLNTNNTCQDLANYDGSAIKTIEFCDKDISIVGYPMHPLLESAKLSPTKIVKNKALGKRAQISLTCRDAGMYSLVDYADLDPYWATRTHTPQGSFWRILKAIFKYYNGSALRIKTTYIADPYDPTDCVTRHYILDDIQGPNKSGKITLVARDILKLADDKRAKWPVATTGVLAAAMTAGSTASFTITNGAGQYTDAGAYIRIGDDLIQYTSGSDSGDDYIIAGTITRNAYGSTASAHEIGDSVQLCYELNATNIVDFLETLIFTAAGINSGYKDATWATEKANWFTSTLLNGLITKPEGVTKLVEELQEHHALFYIWWNEITQKIMLKAVAPTPAITASLNDAENIIEVLSVKEGSGDRLTRSYVLFGPHNPIETDDFEDYKTAYVTIDADAENSAQYGDQREAIAKARFLTSEGLAIQFGARKLARYRDPPKILELILDAKDTDLWTGDITNVSTRYLQDVNGSNKQLSMQVFSVQEITTKLPGTHYKYELVDTVYQGRYGRIMSSAANSTYGAATDTEKATGCYICAAGGANFADDGGPYQIV